jgi:hypothetical protein
MKSPVPSGMPSGSPATGGEGAILQHQPMRWPPDRVVDWADASERRAWVAELRLHIFNLFVVGLEGTKRRRKRAWTLERSRESLLANKQVIDQTRVGSAWFPARCSLLEGSRRAGAGTANTLR